jgi:hypothetical protein
MRLIRIAFRLSQLEAGSDAADRTIHDALGLSGAVRSYTTSEAAARSLLPDGFEWMQPIHSAGAVYAACRRRGTGGDLPSPHYGAWGRTTPLAACSAVIRACSKLQQEC